MLNPHLNLTRIEKSQKMRIPKLILSSQAGANRDNESENTLLSIQVLEKPVALRLK